MKISIITLFPEMFSGVFDSSIIKRAQKEGKVSIELTNLRNFGIGRHSIVDDKPYGGGVGMVLRVDVVDNAIQSVKKSPPAGGKGRPPAARLPAGQGRQETVILLDPKGKVYNQQKAEELSRCSHLILVCGHYEGFDERVRHFTDESISIGDYVLSGGEIPAMVIAESVIRLIPEVLKKKEAVRVESFSQEGILEYPQYTRPRTYKGLSVPSVLLSGNQAEVEKTRKAHAIALTKTLRPSLLKSPARKR